MRPYILAKKSRRHKMPEGMTDEEFLWYLGLGPPPKKR